MNIYARQGHKVKFLYDDAGYENDKEKLKKYLKLGEEYTVCYTEVHSWYTNVELEEFPDIKFNSCAFEDVIEQPEYKDREHPDYRSYNT